MAARPKAAAKAKSKPSGKAAGTRGGRTSVEARGLRDQKCVPCEGGAPRLGPREVARLCREVPSWKLVEGKKLHRRLDFDDFVTLMEFVNEMATLAEDEGHHPDFAVHYDKLDVDIWTHAIGGLSENDFVLAAKIDHMLGSRD